MAVKRFDIAKLIFGFVISVCMALQSGPSLAADADVIVLEIDAQRFINPTDWRAAKSTMPNEPWNYYGSDQFDSWLSGLKWINANAGGMPLGLNLYNKLERIVLKNHYYKGFEQRRILAAYYSKTISAAQKNDLMDRIDRGEKINYSGVDHSSLPAKFRWDPLDEFIHNGDEIHTDGTTRILTSAQIEGARNNSLMQINWASIRQVGEDKYTGEILYPRVKDLKKLVVDTLAETNKRLELAKSPLQIIEAVNYMQRNLMTIHRSLDGNGRVIRLLSDLIYKRNGLPPPLTPWENDIFTPADENPAKNTILQMAKFAALKASHLSFQPEVPEYLFHWTSPGSLRWMSGNNPKPGLVPMQTIPSEPHITIGRPLLSGRWGTFAWSNPVTGLYATASERYAKPSLFGEAPRLLAMKPARDSRVLVLRTHYEAEVEVSLKQEDYWNYDLLYHEAVGKDGSLEYKEWVVLNQNKITHFSADPAAIRPLIEPYLAKLKDPSYKFPVEQLHIHDAQPNGALKLVVAFLKGGTEGIPEDLLRTLETPAIAQRQNIIIKHEHPLMKQCRKLLKLARPLLSH